MEIKWPSSELDQSINDVLKDKKFYLEKAIARIQLKSSRKYFLSNSMVCNEFYFELRFSSEGLLFMNCPPAEFKKVKTFINIVVARTNNKRKTDNWNSHTS